MLHYTIVFLVIALIAGVLGFGGIAGSAESKHLLRPARASGLVTMGCSSAAVPECSLSK